MTPEQQAIFDYLVDKCSYNRQHIKCAEVQGEQAVIALFPYLTTWGLQYGVTRDGIEGRFCFQDPLDAINAFTRTTVLDAYTPPDGPGWIKHKGSLEYGNPNHPDYDEQLDDFRPNLPSKFRSS